MKLMMVCLGNICRSPMAEGIVKHVADQRDDKVEVDSCGTAGYHVGEKADSRAIDTLRLRDIDISQHRASQFSKSDFEKYDHILVMDSSNLDNVLRLANSEADRNKVEMISNFAWPGENRPLADPYYGDDNGFENVADMLIESANALLDKIYE